MNGRVSNNIKKVYLEIFQIRIKVQLVILVFTKYGKFTNFPKNFGNLNKFSMAPSDSVANNTTSNGGCRLTNITSNGIDGLNARNLSYLIGTSGAALAGNAVTGSELNKWCRQFNFHFRQ